MEKSEKKGISRRTFLKGAGAGTVLVSTGGVYRAYDQGVFSTGQGPAYEPWKNWRTDESEGPLPLVRAAILAANAHNSQPWLFRVTESRIDLFYDTTRNIGAIDPMFREMYISLGCALENLLLAAEANGYAYQLTLMPDDSDPAHATRIDLTPGETYVSELYKAIPDRHTNRFPKNGPVPKETLKALEALGNDIPAVRVFWFTTDEERRRVGEGMVQATEAYIADAEQVHGGDRWGRQSWQDVQRYRDGITIDTAPISPILRAIAKMLPPGLVSEEQGNKIFLKAMKELHVTTAAFGIIAVRDNLDNAQRIQGGRLWQRMHLWGTTQGLAMGPINIMAERADREDTLGVEPQSGNALKKLIGDPDWQTLMPFGLGYPTSEALASPRRAVEDVLIYV